MRQPRDTDLARGRWRDILVQLGVPTLYLTGRHTACPICGQGKDRFRFDNRKGDGTWFCSKCGNGNGIHLVMGLRKTDFRGACEAIRHLLPSASPAPRLPKFRLGKDVLNKLWSRSRPLTAGEPAATYLAARGLPDVQERALRSVRALGYSDGDSHGIYPGLIAMVSDAAGKPVTIHRTYLADQSVRPGCKADVQKPRKMMPTDFPPGGAVRLGDGYGYVMGVSEGIETALSVTALFDVPCWAAVSACGLAKFKWPEGVRELLICGDNDASFAGQSAAYQLAHRAQCSGLGVTIEFPKHEGCDWNDVLRGRDGGTV